MTSRSRSSTKEIEHAPGGGRGGLSTHPVGSPALGGPRLWAGRVRRAGERGILAPPPTCWVIWGEPPTLSSHSLVERQGGGNLPAAREDAVGSGVGNPRHVVTRCGARTRSQRQHELRIPQRREVRAHKHKRASWDTSESLPPASLPGGDHCYLFLLGLSRGFLGRFRN